MSDPELQRILQRRMSDMMKKRDAYEEETALIDLTSENFDRIVNGGKPVIVDFWAVWCAPCRIMDPIFERLAKKYGDRMVFGKLNVDENSELAARYNVLSIPSYIVFVNGAPMDMVVGAVGEGGLEKLVTRHVGQ